MEIIPKVTVVIPSYNHAKFIGEAIQSVLDQTYQNFEILICDDCSSDNSVEIIRQFSDQRISLSINLKNMGAAHTVNNLIAQAKCEYIALLNSDDVWLPEKLEKQVKLLDSIPQYAAAFSDVEFIEEDGSPSVIHHNSKWFSYAGVSKYQIMREFFALENHIAHPTIMIRRSVYESIGLYNPLLALTPDFEMWVRIFMKHDIYIFSDKFTKLRILSGEKNASSLSINNKSRFAFEAPFILDQMLNIQNLEFLSKIFPDSINLIHPDVTNADIPFILGLIAVKVKNSIISNWGARVLYQQFRKKDMLLHYETVYGMSENDFTLIINSLDICDIKNQKILLDDKNIEIERYKSDIINKNIEIEQYKDDIVNKNDEINKSTIQISELSEEIKTRDIILQEKNDENLKLLEMIQEQTDTIKALQEYIDKTFLKRIKIFIKKVLILFGGLR